MLWAIDVGNTQTVVGVFDGEAWRAEWRLTTDHDRTEDELAAHLVALAGQAGIPWSAGGMIVASVVPPVDQTWRWFGEKYLGTTPQFLRSGASVGLKVDYEPVSAVGADRLANAIGALAVFDPPIVVVDFGTATTLDCIDKDGVYVGGAILPGVTVSLQSLVGKTAKLPSVALEAPKRAVGRTTTESLQSGVVLGYAGAVDTLVRKVSAELGQGVTTVATGGLGKVFQPLCESVESYDPVLTLDGLRIAYERLMSGAELVDLV